MKGIPVNKKGIPQELPFLGNFLAFSTTTKESQKRKMHPKSAVLVVFGRIVRYF
jgi:hypothetical protein